MLDENKMKKLSCTATTCKFDVISPFCRFSANTWTSDVMSSFSRFSADTRGK